MRSRTALRSLTALASGDFACNLYWQSVSLYLLFFYTDVLHLPPAVAGLLYMGGALWDGVADLIVGILVQRTGVTYRRVVAWGAAPLGIAFVLLYAPGSIVVRVFAVQIAFRTFYAIVNVPYAAWSARISDDSADRTILAGLRMMFGTGAMILVALGTPGIARAATGDATGAAGFALAATAFAAIGIPMLIVVARTAPEAIPVATRRGQSVGEGLRALIGNRAFVTLNLAAMASAAAATILTQSVLYYFRHVAHDDVAGPQALAAMGVAGAVVVPLWMGATTRLGARAAWFIAAAAGLASIGGYAAFGGASDAAATMVFLVAMQVALTGFNLGFWAMLPDTVEYGERAGGLRVEAMAFGVAAFSQKVALAGATAALGLFYDHIGYTGLGPASSGTVVGIRWLMLAGPAAGLAISATVMLANPLKRGVHAAIVADLRRRGR